MTVIIYTMHMSKCYIVRLQSSVEGTHSLIIASIHVTDSDCYKCEAVNECGSVQSSAHIAVQR